MATTTENRPRILTGAESEFDHASRATQRPEVRVNQSNQGSGATFAYIILALVVIVGGYFLYTNYSGVPATAPATTQSDTTLPKSEVIVPTPPAASTATPPADAPVVTPDAPAPVVPATPPATTTTP
jgi:hypothetical protein